MDRIIHQPGKFEGEHVSIPYFWECALDSSATEDVYVGETLYSFFELDAEDKAKFPDLEHEYGLLLWERSDGFVCSEWFATKAEYDAALADYQTAEDSEDETESDPFSEHE